MKKIVFTAFFLFCFSKIYAQNIVVLDSSNGEPIPFAIVKTKGGGFYTNIRGKFDLNKIETDSLSISLMGYEKRNFSINDIKDTVFLQPLIYTLDPVLITKGSTPIEIKPGKKARFIGSWPLRPKTEIITFLYPHDKYNNAIINSVKIKFDNIKGQYKRQLRRKKIKAYVRLHIYQVVNNDLGNNIFSSVPIKIIPYSNDEINIDISNCSIRFSDKGIAISVEFIGYSKITSFDFDRDNTKYVRPVLTEEKNDFYYSETYLRLIFNNKQKLKSLNKIIENHSTLKKVNRNLSIGLTFLQ